MYNQKPTSVTRNEECLQKDSVAVNETSKENDEELDKTTCFFNRGVSCVLTKTAPNNSSCPHCGWNPEERQRRSKIIRARRKVYE